MQESQRLHQLAAVVTGAATGIGEAIARVFAQQGARVLALDLAESGIDSHYRNVANVSGHVLDVAADDAPDAFAALVGSELGRLDILVNNAGVMDEERVEAGTDAHWDRIMANNVRPAYRLSRVAIPMLKRSPAGRIVNLGALHSGYSTGGHAAYAASKHALAGLTRSLAGEVGGHGITVNFIQPGAIMTDMTRAQFREHPDHRDDLIQRSAMGRLGEPLDVARVALFLASDDAAFVTGTGIVVDGGVSRA